MSSKIRTSVLTSQYFQYISGESAFTQGRRQKRSVLLDVNTTFSVLEGTTYCEAMNELQK